MSEKRIDLDAARLDEMLATLQDCSSGELFEIWLSTDTGEWTAEALEACRQILTKRLGPLPPIAEGAGWPRGRQLRADARLEESLALAEVGDYGAAFIACRAAMALAPERADLHAHYGQLLELTRKPLLAMAAYAEALRLDSTLTHTATRLREAELEWSDGQPLDWTPEPGEAAGWSLVDTSTPDTPVDAEDDTAAYEAALRNADGDVPATVYLDETARYLPGWPGYRTRPGRSGFDWLDTQYEAAHIVGQLCAQVLAGLFGRGGTARGGRTGHRP